jgi:hypothetical protein
MESEETLKGKMFRLMRETIVCGGLEITYTNGQKRWLRLDLRGWYTVRKQGSKVEHRITANTVATHLRSRLTSAMPRQLRLALKKPTLLINAFGLKAVVCPKCGSTSLGCRDPHEDHPLGVTMNRFIGTHDGRLGGPCGGSSDDKVYDPILL